MGGACLAGATLPISEIAFLKKEMRFSNWSNVLLGEANFAGALLDGAVFEGCILRAADFSGCNLTMCNFTSADLSRANISNSTITHARFTRCNISHCKGADTCNWSDVNKAMCAGLIATNITLRHADFSSANFSDANFSSSRLIACKFDDAILQRARFSFAEASDSTFLRCNLQDANMTCAMLHRAKFGDANMSRAVIDGADCASADFTRCDMTGVALGVLKVSVQSEELEYFKSIIIDILDFLQVSRAKFAGADVSGTDWSRVDASEALLKGVKGIFSVTGYDAASAETAKGDKPPLDMDAFSFELYMQRRSLPPLEETISHSRLEQERARTTARAGPRSKVEKFEKATYSQALLDERCVTSLAFAARCDVRAKLLVTH